MHDRSGAILAFDFGEKRIGVAVGNLELGLAHPLTTVSEENTAIDHFGELLTKAGYSYYGTERLYSGVDGRELKANIFFGVVHYQRLRHMVSDKWQVSRLTLL